MTCGGEVLEGEMPGFTEELFPVPSTGTWFTHQLPCIGQLGEGWKTDDISPSSERYSNFYQKASDFKEENVKKCCGNIKMNKIRGN